MNVEMRKESVAFACRDRGECFAYVSEHVNKQSVVKVRRFENKAFHDRSVTDGADEYNAYRAYYGGGNFFPDFYFIRVY